MPPPMWNAPPRRALNLIKSRIILTKSPNASSSSKSCVAPLKKLSPKMSSSSYLCGNQPVSQVILRNIAWTFVSLHAIEPTRPWGQRRVDGVESPRHRADAVTGPTSRRWREIATPSRRRSYVTAAARWRVHANEGLVSTQVPAGPGRHVV